MLAQAAYIGARQNTKSTIPLRRERLWSISHLKNKKINVKFRNTQ